MPLSGGGAGTSGSGGSSSGGGGGLLSGFNFTPPAAPGYSNSVVKQNGQTVASSYFDKKKNRYVTDTVLSPDEQAIQTGATGILKDLIPQFGQAANLSDEALTRGVNAYTAPQYAQLDESYNRALGGLDTNAAANGVMNSIGTEDYRVNAIEKARAQGRADIAAGGEQQRYALAQQALQPFGTAIGILNGQTTNYQNQMNQNLGNVQNQQLSANNFNLSNYQNLLSNYNNSFLGKLRNYASSKISP